MGAVGLARCAGELQNKLSASNFDSFCRSPGLEFKAEILGAVYTQEGLTVCQVSELTGEVMGYLLCKVPN